MHYSFKDVRKVNERGNKVDETQFAGKLQPALIARIMKDYVFTSLEDRTDLGSVVINVKTIEEGFVASKHFITSKNYVGELTTLLFTDFEVKGLGASLAKDVYEKLKVDEFGESYIMAKKLYDKQKERELSSKNSLEAIM